MILRHLTVVLTACFLASCGGGSETSGTFRSPELGEAIRIFPGDEVELQSSDGNVVGIYTDEGDRLRLVFEFNGTKRSQYFQKIPEGLRDENGEIFYNEEVLAKNSAGTPVPLASGKQTIAPATAETIAEKGSAAATPAEVPAPVRELNLDSIRQPNPDKKTDLPIAPSSSNGTAYTPQTGSPERTAVCDAMRAYVIKKDAMKTLPQKILFQIENISILGNYCAFEAVPVFEDGSSISTEYLPDYVYEAGLKREGAVWKVVWDLTGGDMPDEQRIREIWNEFPKDFPAALIPRFWKNLFGKAGAGVSDAGASSAYPSLILGSWLGRKIATYHADGTWTLQRHELNTRKEDFVRTWKIEGNKLIRTHLTGTGTDTIRSLTATEMVLVDDHGNAETHKRFVNDGSAVAKPGAILEGELVSDYKAIYDPGNRSLRVEMEWLARFGKYASTVGLDSLNMGSAEVEEVGGGAFQGAVSVQIHTNGSSDVKDEQWPMSVTGEVDEASRKVTRSGSVTFHCKTRQLAERAVAKLAALQGR